MVERTSLVVIFSLGLFCIFTALSIIFAAGKIQPTAPTKKVSGKSFSLGIIFFAKSSSPAFTVPSVFFILSFNELTLLLIPSKMDFKTSSIILPR